MTDFVCSLSYDELDAVIAAIEHRLWDVRNGDAKAFGYTEEEYTLHILTLRTILDRLT